MSKPFILFYCLLATCYLALMPHLSGVTGMLVKASPILFLLWPARLTRPLLGLWLFAAVLFSAGGDIFLASQLPNQFVFGLSSFLLAHVAYIFAMHRLSNNGPWPRKAIVLLAVYCVVLAAILLPNADGLAIPVLLYAIVICSMAVFAVRLKDRIVVLGALLFVASDTMIGINRFVMPVPLERYAVMSTYYLAQICLVYGLVKHATTRQPA